MRQKSAIQDLDEGDKFVSSVKSRKKKYSRKKEKKNRS